MIPFVLDLAPGCREDELPNAVPASLAPAVPAPGRVRYRFDLDISLLLAVDLGRIVIDGHLGSSRGRCHSFETVKALEKERDALSRRVEELQRGAGVDANET